MANGSDATPIFCHAFKLWDENDPASTVIIESSRTALESALRCDCSAKRTIKF